MEIQDFHISLPCLVVVSFLFPGIKFSLRNEILTFFGKVIPIINEVNVTFPRESLDYSLSLTSVLRLFSLTFLSHVAFLLKLCYSPPQSLTHIKLQEPHLPRTILNPCRACHQHCVLMSIAWTPFTMSTVWKWFITILWID